MRVITAFVLSAICLLLISSLEPMVGYKSEQIHSAREAYQRAIDRTYQELAASSYEIIHSSDLKEKIEWGLKHSVVGLLNQYLNPEILSHSQIIDDRCGFFAASSNLRRINLDCSKLLKQTRDPSFFWTHENSHSSLHLITSFSVNKQKYFLIVSQELNKQWVNQHPELARLWKPLILMIGKGDRLPAEATLIINEGRNSNTNYSASLYSEDPFLKLIPQSMLTKKESFRYLTLIASIITFILLISVVISLSLRERKHQNQINQFYHWVKNLSTKSQQIKDSSLRTSKLSETIKQIQEAVEEQYRINLEKDHAKNKTIQKLSQDIKELERELLLRSSKLHILQRQSSAKNQLKEISLSFLNMQKDTHDHLENLNDIVVHNLSLPIRDLSNLIKSWQEDISNISTRKFLRNLDERFDHSKGKTLLQLHFETILKSIRQIVDLSMQSAIYGQKALKNSSRSIKTAEHFLALSGGNEDYSLTLLELLCNGQNLLPTVNQRYECTFTNQLDKNYTPSPELLPPSTWSSIIYHLLSAMIDTAQKCKANKLHFHISQKKRNELWYLVFTLSDQNGEHARAIEYSKKSQEHIEHARHLIHLSKLKILELPTIVGIAPLAIIWPEEEIDKKPFITEKIET